jgi:5-methyltetrahydrofolate--homocysteine methyltransferase
VSRLSGLSNPEVIAAVLPHCKREGVVNSVFAGIGKDRHPVPPARAYELEGGRAALLQRRRAGNGIGRLELFEQILDAAKRYEIDESRLLIDPVLHALATDEAAFVTYAECAHEIRKRSDRVHIVSGMSNISFGLPARAQINRAFLVLAMQAGMDSAILNPLDRELMGLLYATRALLGEDEYCMEYIGAYREGKFAATLDKKNLLRMR